ncbi:Uncharacterized protein dnm_003680 [Desulfonema magnum]|uniref:Uncharacterized protein n=1 Tax=Desulfonema magnum TaxID=45655 RepID=A0A975GK50_9BACT|nr:Uncharacterized protein dnm_003680 [Desulfonema magnum]
MVIIWTLPKTHLYVKLKTGCCLRADKISYYYNEFRLLNYSFRLPSSGFRKILTLRGQISKQYPSCSASISVYEKRLLTFY